MKIISTIIGMLKMELLDTISNVKAKIHDKKSISYDPHKIIILDKQLEGVYTLSYHNIYKDLTISHVPFLWGGVKRRGTTSSLKDPHDPLN